MSEEPTQNIPDGRSFEERVFARFDSIDARLSGMDSRLITVEERLTTVEERLTTLEERVDRRLKETRPIWEQVLARLDNLENEMRNGFRKLERQVGLLAEDVLIVRADQRDLEKRVSKLEPEPTQ